jgi:hypothetical protein
MNATELKHEMTRVIAEKKRGRRTCPPLTLSETRELIMETSRKAQGDESFSQAYREALKAAEEMGLDITIPPGKLCGTFVNDRNEIKPITAPRPETEPIRKICPISIDCLLAADGRVDEAETGEVEELGLFKPERVVEAGVDAEDDVEDDPETAAFEAAVDAAASDEAEGHEGGGGEVLTREEDADEQENSDEEAA